MKKQGIFLALVLLCFVLPSVSASHFIIGHVENAIDGRSPDGMKVVLWNPENGFKDGRIDVIGEQGNSVEENTYMFDCHILDNPCNIGDELKLRVLNSRGYKTKTISVIVGSGGYDIAEDLLLQRGRGRIRERQARPKTRLLKRR